ncbi:conserved hypothetical protein [Paraoerskovia marina]|uniref:Purine nucleoside phosphorylase n=1 Tax=Paraoerskovia marina TaxID=545619 RepID=A0A1H1TQ42_9CELL|nr:polyphenol oxidase family protein [Paraoerskovia marina]SDS62254.1 conserved hypothetical protein [Paraoerskovia marina]
MGDDLSVLEVDLGPGVRAGFTRRHPGRSSGSYAGLNLGLHVGDEAADVRRNRALVDAWAGVPVRYVDQVHGTTVVDSTSDETAADGLIVRKGHAGAVMVADCVPVLLADASRRVGAAVHAGRRGLTAGVVAVAVDALVARGARPDSLRAVVGPSVCGACYEVPAEMHDEVVASVPSAAARTRDGAPALDLARGAVAQLRALGVADTTRVGGCTAEEDEWYSHREATWAGGVTGRFAGVLRI